MQDSDAAISDGELRLEAEVSTNWIPIPCDFDGSVKLDMHFVDYPSIMINAKKVRVELIGQAVYVEDFPGSET